MPEGLSHKTASRYIGILEQMFLLKRVEPWSTNRLHRIVKTPKMQFLDSGVLSTLTDLVPDEAKKYRGKFGNVLETFVFLELYMNASVSEGEVRMFHYRDQDKVEVDVVVEDSRSNIVGIEVKASATVSRNDLRGLKRLQEIAGARFVQGILLYDGEETLPVGEGLRVVPISSLWCARS